VKIGERKILLEGNGNFVGEKWKNRRKVKK